MTGVQTETSPRHASRTQPLRPWTRSGRERPLREFSTVPALRILSFAPPTVSGDCRKHHGAHGLPALSPSTSHQPPAPPGRQNRAGVSAQSATALGGRCWGDVDTDSAERCWAPCRRAQSPSHRDSEASQVVRPSFWRSRASSCERRSLFSSRNWTARSRPCPMRTSP
jgi:hypothetical protein